jgi:hypothetical protein
MFSWRTTAAASCPTTDCAARTVHSAMWAIRLSTQRRRCAPFLTSHFLRQNRDHSSLMRLMHSKQRHPGFVVVARKARLRMHQYSRLLMCRC